MNKIEVRITFKLKNGYSFELLTLKTMEWLGRSMQKVTKNKNQKNLSKVERDDVVVLKSNIAHNDYQMNSRNLFSHSINI